MLSVLYGPQNSRVRLFATLWTVAYQASPSMGFSRQEYWSGVPLPMGNRWGNMETVSDFIFGGFKITADGDCSHEIKRHSLEGKL